MPEFTIFLHLKFWAIFSSDIQVENDGSEQEVTVFSVANQFTGFYI